MYTEQELKKFIEPISDKEDEMANNARLMVQNAVDIFEWEKIGLEKPIVGLKGSYYSNTSVRNDSDIDLYLLFPSFSYIINNKLDKSILHTGGGPSFSNFREAVENALIQKFSCNNVNVTKDKAINIKENTYHLSIDVIPTVRAEFDSYCNIKEKGICFYTKKSSELIISFPEQDHENGKIKNERTQFRYKKVVRLLKHIKNDIDEKKYPSYLIECLLYNVPDNYFNFANYKTGVLNILEYLYSEINNNSNKFVEVNGIKLLFYYKQKWTKELALEFLKLAYNRIFK